MPRDREQSRKKILHIAERIFARKGFDGARVDEIAAQAGVNKALIYYYFKSKQKILEEIFRDFSEDYMRMVIEFTNGDFDLSAHHDIKKFLDSFIPYLESKKDVLRIIVAESLKSGDEVPTLFKFMEFSMKSEIERTIEELKAKGLNVPEEKEQMKVTEFFTGLMPVVNFIIYQEKWARYFKVKKEDLKNWFLTAYEDTHVAYHQRNRQ